MRNYDEYRMSSEHNESPNEHVLSGDRVRDGEGFEIEMVD